MANDAALASLADLLVRQQRLGAMHGRAQGAQQPVSVQATPPALPAYQAPGMSLPSMQAYLQKQSQPQPAPPAPAMGAPPAPPAGAPPPMAPPGGAPPPAAGASALQATTDPTVPPMPPSTPIGMAPGMGQQDQGMVAQILAALKARDPQLPPQMAMGQPVS